MNDIRSSLTLYADSSVSSPAVSKDFGSFGAPSSTTPAKMYRQPTPKAVQGIENNERLRLIYTGSDDAAVLPGQMVTEDVVTRNKTKARLIELIRQFAAEGFSRADGVDGKITPETAEAANILFNTLLPAAKIPKVAPDGEGGLMVVWEHEVDPVVLVVDNWKVHLITAATTPRAQYFEDLPFDGEQVPRQVIEAVPTY